MLLLDAGEANADKDQQIFSERHFSRALPGLNWGYKTVPQDYLNGRQIEYDRGKGLGGSTAINFCVYTRGARADYEHWANLVDDDTWCWENVQKRFNRFERCQRPPKELEKFVSWSDSCHGFEGELNVGMSLKWDESFADFLEKTWEYYPKNLDHNSGDVLGAAVCQLSTHDGYRVTASGAFLSSPPANLTIRINSPVTKILFQGKKAVGVETSGKKLIVRKEVILSAGTVDTPKLLLLSGCGPTSDLNELGIPTVQDIPGIGRNLQDHMHVFLTTTQKPNGHHRTSYINSPETLAEARKLWVRDQTGPLANFYMPHMICFVRNEEILASKEFQTLDPKSQELWQMDSKPTHEIISQNPSIDIKEPDLYLATGVVIAATETGGEIKLRSTNPFDEPLIDPKYLSHPFSRYVAVQAIRETLEYFRTPSLAKDTISLACGPKGESDEEIMDYIKANAISTWHPCGTVKMGKPEDPSTCVDTSFKVMGLEGLRVVDMSVAPILPSAHTQAVAYLIGETASEKIISEYS